MFRRRTRVAPAPADRWGMRYTRYSEWSLTRHEEKEENGTSLDRLLHFLRALPSDIELTLISSSHHWPSEAEMQAVSPRLRLVQYFQWLSNHRSAVVNQQHISRLVVEGADVSVVYGRSQQTVLHEVAAHWDIAVAALLLEQRANVNATDGGGRSPLHYAAYTEHTDMLEWLLDHGG